MNKVLKRSIALNCELQHGSTVCVKLNRLLTL